MIMHVTIIMSQIASKLSDVPTAPRKQCEPRKRCNFYVSYFMFYCCMFIRGMEGVDVGTSTSCFLLLSSYYYSQLSETGTI